MSYLYQYYLQHVWAISKWFSAGRRRLLWALKTVRQSMSLNFQEWSRFMHFTRTRKTRTSSPGRCECHHHHHHSKRVVSLSSRSSYVLTHTVMTCYGVETAAYFFQLTLSRIRTSFSPSRLRGNVYASFSATSKSPMTRPFFFF